MKKAFIAFGLAIILVCPAFANENERWLPYFSNKESMGSIDTQTLEYDSKDDRLYFWSKSEKGNGTTLYFKHYVDLQRKRMGYAYVIVDGMVNGKRKHIESDNFNELAASNDFLNLVGFKISSTVDDNRPFECEVLPGSAQEGMVNIVEKSLNMPPIWNTFNHSWKIIRKEGDKYCEICTDVFIYDEKQNICRVFVKEWYKNKLVSLSPVIVNLGTHMIYAKAKNRMAAPDTVYEAIYNETVKLVETGGNKTSS